MPDSPYRPTQLTLSAGNPADRLRSRLIDSLRPYAEHGPTLASTCYVWPSIECPVGCGHCNYATPISASNIRKPKVVTEAAALMRIVNGMGLWKAVLSGGGEPMVQPEFCSYFVSEVDSPNLAEIELITSAHFANTEEETYAALSNLVTAWRQRSNKLTDAAFTIRLSVDWFHAQRIGVGPAASVIRMLGEPEFAGVNSYVRSVLLDNDPTIQQLADALDAELSDIIDYQQTMTLPDGRRILVYSKNLIIEGRMNKRKLSRLAVSLPKASEADEFGQRFKTAEGKQIPARTYNGPEVRHLEGLACLIDDQGMVRILEGNDVSRSAYVGDFDSWSDAVSYLYRDPITVFLVDNGPVELAARMADAFPDSVGFATDTNQLYHLTELLLATPERRLAATLLVLEDHVRRGLQQVDPDLRAECVQLLGDRGIKVTS